MATLCHVQLFLLLALAFAVHSEIGYPRFEFGDTKLGNNSYILIDRIGEGNNSLRCVTDYKPCCNRIESGGWYNEREMEVLRGLDRNRDLYVTTPISGEVNLNRRRGGQSGMWRCDVPGSTGEIQIIYIYIGTTGTGSLTSANISNFALHTEANEYPPEFTLTCRSEGGPVAAVVWSRNGLPVEENSDHNTSQIIVNTSRVTVYENKLRVRGRENGLYMCSVSNTLNSLVSMMFSVKVAIELTAPMVTAVRAEGSPVAGSNYSLICSITIPDFDSNTKVAVTVLWEDPSQKSIVKNGTLTDNSNVFHSRLSLDPLTFNREGVYACIASYTVNEQQSPTDKRYYYVAIRLAVPSVIVIGSGSGEAGSSYILTCSVSLSVRARGSSVFIQWEGPGISTAPMDDVSTKKIISRQLSLDPLTLAHRGEYVCTANYTLDGKQNSRSDKKSVRVTIPTPSVFLTWGNRVKKAPLVGENVILYCDTHLYGVKRGNDVRIDVTWHKDAFEVSNSTRVTYSGPAGNGTTVQSTLTFSPVQFSDKALYKCLVTVISLQGQPLVTKQSQYLLSIADPVSPVLPEQVMIREVTAESAIIHWTVPYIAYSPEIYTVQYGTSNDSLIQNTDSEYSGEDVNITNKTYSVKLSDLKGNTTYYVQVMAINTANISNTSSMESFATLPIMEMESDVINEKKAGFSIGAVAAITTIFAVFALLVSVVIIVSVLLARFKQQRRNACSVHKKCSLHKMENLPIETPPQGMANKENDVGDDYYFQDPTTIVPGFTPIPVEKFPEYVQDMISNNENKLQEEFMALSRLPQPPCTVALLPHNNNHNRFNNIYPFDNSRVCLMEIPGEEGSDYINASFIDGYNGRKNAYIAAQGPVEESVERFWSMVWQYKLKTIVMLTECVEATKTKCVQYWPENIRSNISLERFRMTYTSNKPFAEYEIRKFKLQNTTEPESQHLSITQFHYTAWPDHGVPDNVMSLIGFIRCVRKQHPVSERQPLLVHCSAGVGRTGTLILLDIMMQQMQAEGSFSVHHCLRKMRMQRMKMVQSQEQYKFVHCGLSELVMCGETEVAALNLRIAANNLERKTEHGITGFQKQLQILEGMNFQPPVRCSEAERACNKNKNRFPEKLPNDTYRVRLRHGALPGSDYINASFVNGYKQKGAYIATQCPLKNTVADFWRMINEFQCGCIVMLCKLEEDDQENCYCYWPSDEGESMVYGKLTVKLLSVKTHGDVVVRRIEVVGGAARFSKLHVVTLFQLTSWPMKGLPHPTAIISLIDHLTNAQMRSSSRRTVIMCSDGVSRTGTFLIIHSQVERLKTEGVVDFLQAIKSARLQRAGIVSNADHYAFCHDVLNTYLDDFDTYSNFKELV